MEQALPRISCSPLTQCSVATAVAASAAAAATAAAAAAAADLALGNNVTRRGFRDPRVSMILS